MAALLSTIRPELNFGIFVIELQCYKRDSCFTQDIMKRTQNRRVITILALIKLFNFEKSNAQSTTTLVNTTTPTGVDFWDPYGAWFRIMLVCGGVGFWVLLAWVFLLTICFVRYEIFTQTPKTNAITEDANTKNLIYGQKRYSFIKNNVPAFADHICC